MTDNTAWNAYFDKFGKEPGGASQLQKYSQTEKSLTNLTFKQARTVFDANKGKGKIGGGGDGGAAASKSGGDDGGGGDLFSALNKGTGITSGLKKVTKEMKTKNQPNRSGKVSAAPSKTSSKPKKSSSAKKVSPPSMKKKGPRLWVENYIEGTQELKECDVRTEVYFLNCKNSGFAIPNKVKAVIMDNCNRLQCEVSEVVSAVEQINCKSCTYYLKKNIPTISIDKCSNPKLVLFQEVIDKKPEIITSMTSDMNISFPRKNADDDWKEVPIPYQFKTSIDPDTGNVTTVPV
eukprot:194368_1